jgi:hypothetical protein
MSAIVLFPGHTICSTCARQGKSACKGRSIPMEKLDRLVTERLADRLLTHERGGWIVGARSYLCSPLAFLVTEAALGVEEGYSIAGTISIGAMAAVVSSPQRGDMTHAPQLCSEKSVEELFERMTTPGCSPSGSALGRGCRQTPAFPPKCSAPMWTTEDAFRPIRSATSCKMARRGR